jgi:2-phospho-L-lactate guanylyltransferase
VQWRVLVPVRPAGAGKSRLRSATENESAHTGLVRAIQQDALAAVLRARADVLASSAWQEGVESIAGVYLISAPGVLDVPPGVEILLDAGHGLNAALRGAAEETSRRHPADAVLALVGDLPSLRSAELREIIGQAANHERSFVADASGHGTTMLTARAGLRLEPSFGLESAVRHRAAGAIELSAGPGARQDVDTVEDLRRCLELGVGARTAEILAHLNPFN